MATFSDVFTYSTASARTMVDSDGLLKWNAHNLLSYSEQFDNAYWFKGGTTVTANQATAPDGTLTADQIDFAASPNANIQVATPVTVGADYTFGIWLSADSETTNVKVQLDGGADQDVTITTTPTLYTFEAAASDASFEIVLVSRDASAATIYAWGAHLYRSDLGGMVNNPDRTDTYVPTVASPVYLPRRDAYTYIDGVLTKAGLQFESEARTNLVTYSNDSSAWFITNGSYSSSGTWVDGNSAILATASGAGYFEPRISLGSATISSPATMSLWLKDNGLGPFTLRMRESVSGSNAINATIDLNAETVTPTAAGTFTNASGGLVDYGNGWYRVWLSGTIGTSASLEMRIYVGGTPTGGVYINGVQLEAASTPTSYIPTTGATATRAAETLTIPAANMDYPTPEVIGPELVTNGTFDTDLSGWGVTGGWVYGTANARYPSGAAANGVLTSLTSFVTGGRTYRVTFNMTTSTGSGHLLKVRVYQNNNGTGTLIYNPGYATQGDNEYYITPSSDGYIAFVVIGTTVEHYLDNISVQEINPLAVSFAMDGFMTYADTGNTELLFFDWRVNSGNYIQANLRTQTTATGEVYHIQAAASVADDVDGRSSQYTPGINVPFSIASRHGSTFINGAVDGTALTADLTPVALPDLSATDLSLAPTFNGYISKFLMWGQDIGDLGIAEASG